MTALKNGDRVHVEFGGVIQDEYPSDASVYILPDGSDTTALVPNKLITKSAPALPTTIGSVILVTQFLGPVNDSWTGMLHSDGWRTGVDVSAVYTPDLFPDDFAFEVLYTPTTTSAFEGA